MSRAWPLALNALAMLCGLFDVICTKNKAFSVLDYL